MKRLVITDMPLKGQNCRIMAQEENGRICSVHLEKLDKHDCWEVFI